MEVQAIVDGTTDHPNLKVATHRAIGRQNDLVRDYSSSFCRWRDWVSEAEPFPGPAGWRGYAAFRHCSECSRGIERNSGRITYFGFRSQVSAPSRVAMKLFTDSVGLPILRLTDHYRAVEESDCAG